MLNLGIIRNKYNQIINHRTLKKIFLNPFLRLFGFEIVSIFDNDVFEKEIICKTKI